MSLSLTTPLARLRGRAGAVCGAGMLVGERHVITCAHVVDDALGRKRGSETMPEEEIVLDLPFLKRHGLSGRVVAWFPMQASLAELEHDPVADIAVLELPEPVANGIRSERARLSTPPVGTAFVTFGYPAGMDNGTEAGGELRLEDSGGWRQVRDVQDRGYFVAPGFSGAPAFDLHDGKLLGMVVAVDRDSEKRLAFVVPTPTLCRAWPPLAKPYKELFAFEEADAELFFGREPFVEELAAKIAERPFVTVIGPSGAGKSSVVMAGLVPRLRASGEWAVAVCRPGRRPLYRLAYALAELIAPPAKDPGRTIAEAEKLEDILRQDPVRVLERAETIVSQLGGTRCLLLVIDQFEELFTHDEAARTDGGNSGPTGEAGEEYGTSARTSARQGEFVAVLEVIGGQRMHPAPLIQAVATLRADFIGRALQDRALAELMRDADVKLGPMTPSELAEAVEKPAACFGVAVEPGLLAEIVAVMKGAAGGLPLMQFALDRLWRRQRDRRLTHEAYSAIGGLEGGLTGHAEKVYASLDADEQARAQRMLTRLVRLAGPGEQGEDTRAIVRRGDISEADWPLVLRLAEARLVVVGRYPESGEETAEVVHEALIHSWSRLRGHCQLIAA